MYGYKGYVGISVSPATVHMVLDATVTGSACESHLLQARLDYLPSTLDTLLLDAGYDDGTLIAAAAKRGMATRWG